MAARGPLWTTWRFVISNWRSVDALEQVELAPAQPVADPAPVERDPFAGPERVEEADSVDRPARGLQPPVAESDVVPS